MKIATQSGRMAQKLRVPFGIPSMSSASSGGLGTRTRPETIATDTAASRARAMGLRSVIRARVEEGDSSTPARVSRDSRRILKWGFLRHTAVILLYSVECGKPRSTLKVSLGIVDLGTSFILY